MEQQGRKMDKLARAHTREANTGVALPDKTKKNAAEFPLRRCQMDLIRAVTSRGHHAL